MIARYFAPLAADDPLAFGLKDDAAVIRPRPGMDLVVTKDALVEGVHFRADDPPETVGQKLLRVNLSDLAAKGATPRGYLMACAFPRTVEASWLEAFAAGLAGDQAFFGIHCLGGDTVSTPGPLCLSLTAIGEVPEGAMLRRSGAAPGDDLWLSGSLGDGFLGLEILTGRLAGFAPRETAFLIDRYRRPVPRVTLGPRLIGLAHAAMDVSDGLLADLGHLAAASGLGASVFADRLPLSDGARRWAGRNPERLAVLAAAGDDYEILCAAPPEARGALEGLAGALGVPLTPIGTLEAGSGVALRGPDGRRLTTERQGYRHF